MKVVVVGAGIVGVSAAWTLAEAGVETVVVDRGPVAGEASGLNAGVIGGGGWGRRPDVDTTLKMGSRDRYVTLAERGHDIGLDRTGTLTLIRTEAEWVWAAELVAGATDRGQELELVDQPDLIEAEPAADPDLLGGVFDPLGARAEPVAATRAIAAEAEAAGATIETGTAVRGLAPTPSGGWELQVENGGTIGADLVVLAAGAWTPALGRLVGVEVPIVAVRGQMWASAPQPATLRHAIAAAESLESWARADHRPDEPPDLTHRDGRRLTRHLYGRQRPNGEIVFGGDRVRSDRPVVDHDGVATNHAHVGELLPMVGQLAPVRTWAGLMPFSLDGRPLLGPVPERDGLFLAGGLASSGFGRGPMAGQLVAELVLDRRPDVDLGPVLPDGRISFDPGA